ncbi:ARM repeat superfamily protein [Rhynchospora pubera]|uniref:ARM repeat superfamily protein n=1 Tax=Rhynchospora pubera TaxID=906938 RepID=A0AAV8E1Y3_9POAL|nr:ARM repeat superfamily protein [Rhynchospora pubera]
MADNLEPVTESVLSADHWLTHARQLIPTAIERAHATTVFPVRWKSIISKLESVPTSLSDLASHPCFLKNTLCRETLQSVASTLSEAIGLAELCESGDAVRHGKLQMQSDIDSLAAKLDLNLRDCALLVKTGVLSDATVPVVPAPGLAVASVPVLNQQLNVGELLARLHIGNAEAKHRVVDSLLEVIREDEKSVLSVLSRSSILAMIQLLSAGKPKVREKAATIICLLAESASFETLLVSEGVLPPLIRLAESGSLVGREKAVITLQRLSMSSDAACAIVRHGGIRPLIDICQAGDSVTQSAAAGALKNLSVLSEVRQTLADEGIVKVMINLLDCGTVLGSKEYAAECLKNLTATNDHLRQSIVTEGGLKSLLTYLNNPIPQEAAVGALRNLVRSVPVDSLLSFGLLPCLVHVLKEGVLGTKQAAASVIYKVSGPAEVKKLVGEFGCIPLLVTLLEAKSTGARVAAAQAITILMNCPQNARELKKDEKSIPNLVQLLDPSPSNTAKKYAIACLLMLSSSKKCKKLMISHGAIGYLKKLSEVEVSGAKKLLERLERGKLRSLFIRK